MASTGIISIVARFASGTRNGFGPASHIGGPSRTGLAADGCGAVIVFDSGGARSRLGKMEKRISSDSTRKGRPKRRPGTDIVSTIYGGILIGKKPDSGKPL